MRRQMGLAPSILLALLLALACTPARSPSVSPILPSAGVPATKAPSVSPTPTAKTTTPTGAVSFAGKTITIVVPFAPGGSVDVTARILSRALPDFLPGRPSVIVRNIPGGDATIGANYVYQSPADGLTAILISSSVTLNQLVGKKAVKYDMAKMPAVIATATGGVFYTKPSVVDKPENLLKAKGMVYGGTTTMGTYLFVPLNELGLFPVDKAVLAYSGSAEVDRAFLAGEVNIAYSGTQGYMKGLKPFEKTGEVLPLFQTGIIDDKGKLYRDSLTPNLDTPDELYQKLMGKAPSGIAWKAFMIVSAARGYEKVLNLPPGTPDGIVKAYWSAAETMAKSAEFRKVADPIVGEGAVWMVGQSGDQSFKQSLAMDAEIRDWFRKALEKRGVVID